MPILLDHACRRTLRRSSLGTESKLHQLAPYIGKIKSSIAASLVSAFSAPGDTVYDPFCGCGTVPLEAWIHGRNCLANDLSPYAYLLTSAKLFPPANADAILSRVELLWHDVKCRAATVEIDTVDQEVRCFFHSETLRELIAWVEVLREQNEKFILAALLGILHHQRPGFLSFPSSHTGPYLRTKNFPPERFPELYTYREIRGRLTRKLLRALKRMPELDRSLYRRCCKQNAPTLMPSRKIDAIISSPPYMRQLDYGRDNRLRLWFLGQTDWKSLDERVSPNEAEFLQMMRTCFTTWRELLPKGCYCVLLLGDNPMRAYDLTLPEVVQELAVSDVGGYRCAMKYTDMIPRSRRVRRAYRGNLAETVIALKRV
jgi:hypothetical protein